MSKILTILKKWGKTIGIIVFLVIAFFAGNSTGFAKNDSPSQTLVLSAKITPFPTMSPVPTAVPVTVINNIMVPTQVPAVITQIVTPTPIQSGGSVTIPTPTLTPIVSPTEAVSPTPSIAPRVTPTPTATPISQAVAIDVTYTGEHANSVYTAPITAGENAWQAVQDAVGVANLQYTDYGGSLGIFITGFNGVDAAANQYYDFQVNGTSSNVGVSSYTVNDHDELKFVLTSF